MVRSLPAAVVTASLVLLACGDDGDGATTSSTAVTTTTTDAPTTTAAPPTTAAPSTAAPTTAVAGRPVTVLDAHAGAGSGEIELTWDGVDGAVGYRVERADDPGGPFTEAATIDLATGGTTRAPGVVFVSAPHADQPFIYVEFGEAPRRYLRVVAVHPRGDAPPSTVVCGAPPGLPDC